MSKAEHIQHKKDDTSRKDQLPAMGEAEVPSVHDALMLVRQASAAVPPRKSAVLTLQRSLGNSQTKRLLQRQTLQRDTAGAAEQPAAAQPTGDDRLKNLTEKLLSGTYAYKGGYTIDVASGQFAFKNPDLVFLLDHFLKHWAPLVQKKATTGGHSSGKSVHDHPDWVTDFQQRLIGQAAQGDKVAQPKKDDPYEDDYFLKWDKVSEGAQSLVEAFMNAWATVRIPPSQAPAGGQPAEAPAAQPADSPAKIDVGESDGTIKARNASNVEEFIHNVGASQSNDQAMLMGGFRNSIDWCANSSGRAVALGLMRRGIRFKGTSAKTPSKGDTLMAMLADLDAQAVRVNTWGGDKASSLKDPKAKAAEEQAAAKAAIDAGNRTVGNDVNSALLNPGDRITIIYGGVGGPISGHVATVVKEELLIPAERIPNAAVGEKFSRVSVVSGNAAGVDAKKTAIRMEAFTREIPPAGYSNLFSAMAGDANTFQYGVVPAKSKAEDKRSDAEKALVAREKELLAKPHPVHRALDPKFKLGVHAPNDPTSGWVVSIIRTGKLDANAMIGQDGKADQEALDKNGLVVFDEASLTTPNTGLSKLYPGALEKFE